MFKRNEISENQLSQVTGGSLESAQEEIVTYMANHPVGSITEMEFKDAANEILTNPIHKLSCDEINTLMQGYVANLAHEYGR